MRSYRCFVGPLLLGALAAPALGTSYVLMEDGPLADQAELIVRAEVGDKWVSDSTGRVMTHYAIMVDEVVKGAAAAAALEVRVLGGIDLDRGLALPLWGMPELASGEEVLLFLRPNDDGTYHVLHLLLGAFHKLEVGDEAYWVRSLDGPGVRVQGSMTAAAATAVGQRDAELFVAWLRDRAGGFEREPDYLRFREMPDFSARFTLITSEVLFRWFKFDDGQTERINRHKNKGEVQGGGKKELKKVVSILNQVKQRSGSGVLAAAAANEPLVRLQVGGKTRDDTAFDACSGETAIVNSDRRDHIEDDFDCRNGGVIAIGGPTCVFPERSFRGQQWLPIAEGAVVVNNNTRCYFDRFTGAYQEVLLHEIGHVLALGHSCGDDKSPKCSKSEVLDDANMRAFTHGQGPWATSLGRDDVAGLAYLYTAEPWAEVWCERWVEGDKKFCNLKKGCGPCGFGQGNCKKNKECAPGLVCEKDAGRRFGLAANVDVCTTG